MKKRHITELTGLELTAAFKSAVSEVLQAATKKKQSICGSIVGESIYIRRPDGTLDRFDETPPKRSSARKRNAA